MMKLPNYEFIYDGIASFTLPAGMCLDHENRDYGEDAFRLVSPDGCLRLCVEFFSSTKSARELTFELFTLEEHDFILMPCPVTTPTGIDGYFTCYKTGEECYEECTLDLGGDARCNFWFLYKESKPCNRELYRQVRNELMGNIKMI